MKIMAVLTVCCVAGCAPAVQHGPWVYSGVSGGFRAAAAAVRESDTDYPGLSLAVDGNLRGGVVPGDSSKPAFSVGLQTSLYALFLAAGGIEDVEVLPQLFAADAYVSLPLSSRYATSVGVTSSVWQTMPYLQIGSKRPDGDAWYTTQAFLFMDSEECCDVDFPGFMWLPSYTWVFANPRSRATYFSIGAGVGRNHDRTIFALTAGAGMEFFRSAARVR
jgi:hypothetical protein